MQVRFEEGPSLPGKYAVHAFLSESNDAVAGSTGMFECVMTFEVDLARRSRCDVRERRSEIALREGGR